jgi:Zn-dependent protease with chaperone function
LKIFAQYFDGTTSDKREVVIEFSEKGIVYIRGEDISFETYLDKVSFSSRVGNIPRVLKFPNGGVAHSDENDKIDKFLNKGSFVHLFESKMRYVLLSSLLLILSVVFFLTMGSDMASKVIAQMIPHSIEKEISYSTLKVLDDYMLKSSNLSEDRKANITKLFNQITQNEQKYHLHFRRGIGENAFALPSGDIVITDELIKFSDGNDKMIYGVLSHERGHVEYKHSMQLLVKASIVSAIVTYFTGDVSSLVATLSTSALNANYSRDFEREADEYAKIKMKQAGISPKYLAEFFIKMGEKSLDNNKSHGYFDSHPSNRERIENLLN